MSVTEPDVPRPSPVESPLSMQELAALLIKHYGLHHGKFDLLVEFQFGAGAVGPNPDKLLPGVIIGIAQIGLAPSTRNGPMTVDAAVINPQGKTRKRASAKASSRAVSPI